MCTQYWFPETSTVVESQGQMADMLGGFEFVAYEGGGHATAEETDHCLCPVDIETIAGKQGWRLDYDSDLCFVTITAAKPS